MLTERSIDQIYRLRIQHPTGVVVKATHRKQIRNKPPTFMDVEVTGRIIGYADHLTKHGEPIAILFVTATGEFPVGKRLEIPHTRIK